MTLDRRDFLKAGAAGALVAGGLVLPFTSTASAKSASTLADANMPRPFAATFAAGPQLRGRVVRGRLQDGSTGLYRLFTVIEKPAMAAIVPGLRTPVWGYAYVDDGGVERPVRVPGPTIDVDRADTVNGGLPVKLRVINRLPARHPQWGHEFTTSTHLHGSASLPQYDGYANDLTGPGWYKDYWYPNGQAARTLWYHDHGVHHTALNAYGGLAAQYHLHDRDQERDLPAGAYDVPVTITDAIFSADGRLVYEDNEFSGLWGDVVLVNGRPWPTMEVKRRVYRFRLLNACLARSFRLHLSDGSPLTVVGSDGGLLPAAVQVSELLQAGAERYEVLIDFSRYPVGTTVDLRNRSARNNRDYDHTDKVMRFRVVDGDFPTTRNTLSPRLPRAHVVDTPVSEAKRTRRFELDHDDVTNVFKIDGRIWQDVVDSEFTKTMTGSVPPAPGDFEVWEFVNNSGGWFHPMHIHLVDFRILSRNGQGPRPYETGPKDTVYVGEDQSVRLLVEFALPPGAPGGKYMVHCHNLSHEDHDMMQQFAVGQLTPAYDPMSAPPQRIRGPIGSDGDLALYGDGDPA
jgi:FtsP/CotA-like multicopper oxidase with cupredoxin domain